MTAINEDVFIQFATYYERQAHVQKAVAEFDKMQAQESTENLTECRQDHKSAMEPLPNL